MRKRMKKIVPVLISVMLISLMLSGCGKSEDDQEPNSTEESGEPNYSSTYENKNGTDEKDTKDDDKNLEEEGVEIAKEVLQEQIVTRVMTEAEEKVLDKVKLRTFKVYDTDSKFAKEVLEEAIGYGLLDVSIISGWSKEQKEKIQEYNNNYYDGLKIEDYVNGKCNKLLYYQLLIPKNWGITEGINAGWSSWDGSYTTKFTIPIYTDSGISCADNREKYWYSMGRSYDGGNQQLPTSSYFCQSPTFTYNGEEYILLSGYLTYLDGDIKPSDVNFGISVDMDGYYKLDDGIYFKDAISIEDDPTGKYITVDDHKNISRTFADLEKEERDWKDIYEDLVYDKKGDYGSIARKRTVIREVNGKPVLIDMKYSDYHQTSSGEVYPAFTITAITLEGSINKCFTAIGIKEKGNIKGKCVKYGFARSTDMPSDGKLKSEVSMTDDKYHDFKKNAVEAYPCLIICNKVKDTSGDGVYETVMSAFDELELYFVDTDGKKVPIDIKGGWGQPLE